MVISCCGNKVNAINTLFRYSHGIIIISVAPAYQESVPLRFSLALLFFFGLHSFPVFFPPLTFVLGLLNGFLPSYMRLAMIGLPYVLQTKKIGGDEVPLPFFLILSIYFICTVKTSFCILQLRLLYILSYYLSFFYSFSPNCCSFPPGFYIYIHRDFIFLIIQITVYFCFIVFFSNLIESKPEFFLHYFQDKPCCIV